MTDTFFDHLWHGDPLDIALAIADEPNVIGPITQEGVAYVNIRSTVELEAPLGIEITEPELSAALLGVWA